MLTMYERSPWVVFIPVRFVDQCYFIFDARFGKIGSGCSQATPNVDLVPKDKSI